MSVRGRSAITLPAAVLGATLGCGPVPIPTPANPDVLQTVLSEVIFDPNATCEDLREAFNVDLPVVQTPAEAGLPFEEHFVAAMDGTTLRVWHLPTRLDRGTVLISMGAAGEIPCYLFTASLLVQNGWSVVMYDYRGFGGSEGVADVRFLEQDLNTVLDWTLTELGAEQVTLFGISLGSIPSVSVAAQRPDDVNGVILDSPIALGQQVLRLAFVLRDQTQVFLDLLEPSLVSEDLIANVDEPLLVFVGEGDIVSPPATVRLLVDRAPGPKVLVTFPGASHARGIFQETGRYAFELEAFLSRTWSQDLPLTVITGGQTLVGAGE